MDEIRRFATLVKRMAAYEAARYATSVQFGKVTEIENGAVRITLFNGFEIGGAQLVLSMFCTERIIHIPYDESANDDSDADSHVHDEDEMLGTLEITYTPGVWLPTPAGASPGQLVISGGGNGMTVTPKGTLGGTVAFKHKHKIHPALPTIKLWRGLEVGDIVVVSEMGNGQYYVHERASIPDGNSNEVLNPKAAGMTGSAKEF